MNGLPADDSPTGDKPCWPSWVMLTEALVRCAGIDDLEQFLGEVDRDEGAMISAVDGKTGECTIFECSRTQHARREYAGEWMTCTNHYCVGDGPPQNPDHEHTPNSSHRYRRIDELMAPCYVHGQPGVTDHQIRVLADDGVERRDVTFATVHTCVACPTTGEIWYTFGGFPSASPGHWKRLDWPWND